jgi:hypothetical protein
MRRDDEMSERQRRICSTNISFVTVFDENEMKNQDHFPGLRRLINRAGESKSAKAKGVQG